MVLGLAVLAGLFVIGRKSLADQQFDWTNVNADNARMQICKYERRNIPMIRVRVNRPTAQLQSVEVRASRGGNSPFSYRKIERDRFNRVIELNDYTEGPEPTFTFRLTSSNAPRLQIKSIRKANVGRCETFAKQAHDIPNGVLRRLRECESSGNYRAGIPNGPYYGAYQFMISTWDSLGRPFKDYDNAAQASENLQDAAVKVLHRRVGDWSPWPVCGRGLPNNFDNITLYL